MSENERKELSEKLHFGLALAERRMLEEKALRNECIIHGLWFRMQNYLPVPH